MTKASELLKQIKFFLKLKQRSYLAKFSKKLRSSILKMVRINRRLGQGRGVNNMQRGTSLSETKVSTVTLPYKADPKYAAIKGTTNTMEVFRVTTEDLFKFAPRIGEVLKYNNASVQAMKVQSVPTAALNVNGTHAIWALFDQQALNWPTGNADAAIQNFLALMRLTGQFDIQGATTKIGLGLTVPRGVRNFNYQDVAPAAEGEAYDPTTICKIVRIYPNTAEPVTSASVMVTFSGLSNISTTTPPVVPDPAYDTLYDVNNLTIDWLIKAFDDLGAKLPVEDAEGIIMWDDKLLVGVIEKDGTRRLLMWENDDEVGVQASWQKIFFPRRGTGGKLISELTELCCSRVSDERLMEGEFYFAHAPQSNWDFDPALVPQGIYLRGNELKPVAQRTADEVLCSVFEQGGLNTNAGQLPEAVGRC